MKLNSLLLSAGFSKRMGKFKPLLNFNNDQIIIEILRKLCVVSNKVFVVTGYNQSQVLESVNKNYPDLVSNNKIEFVHNSNYEQGMFTSLKEGIKTASNADWILYHFVDQPQLPRQFYEEFVEQIDDNYDFIQPNYNDRNGHPVLINRSIFNNIISASDNSSLKEVLSKTHVKKKIWNCNYSEVLEDLDTPNDYKELVGKIYEHL